MKPQLKKSLHPICYFVHRWLKGKNLQCFWRETYDMVEVQRQHFFVWEHGEESLQNFINKLNSFHPTIKVSVECPKETII